MVQATSLFSFWFLTFHLSVSGVISVTFTLVNQCNYTVWPASNTTSGNGNGNVSTTGFVLKSGENSTITASATWTGRFWGRTLCTTSSAAGNFSCVTGDCGSGKIACDRNGAPPVTLAEFSLSGYNDLDFYDVSLLDGYNVPMEVVPMGNCNRTSCPTDLNAVCPTELKVTKNEQVVACQSPCTAFNLQYFCCVGNHSSRETCEPSLYSQLFKTACPRAYSYAYDDGTSSFTCPSTDYSIIFCPASNNASLESLDPFFSSILPDVKKDHDTSIIVKKGHDTSITVKKDHDTLIIVISVLLGSSVFVILTLVGAICFGFPYNRKKTKRSRANKSAFDKNLRNFTFKEIVEATNNFREELGRGSCSIVYKGTIDMTSVAVKKLDKLLQDSEKEFQTEMSVIGQTHHRNLVRLLGYCNEGKHRILVYELMSNGTLASFLFTPLKPNWSQRVDIALGIARGLVYLHEGCCTQIIHCDIKPQNILLDDHYNARISDFGLSKLLLINQSRTETGIRGTKGYVAPDWFRSTPITAKVDTYSFGVVLLEIICCRKNVEKEPVSVEKGILTDWVYDCYRTKRLDILLENDQEAINDMRSLEKFVMIAIWCIQEDSSLRPTMKEVLLMLEGIVEVAIPPSPYLYGSVSCN